MSIATKSISSYLPIRARTNRTRSWMALRTPYRWSACATTATSPNQDGVLGESVGSTWMWTTGSVIFLSSLSHSFSLRMTHSCRLCQFFRAFSPSLLTRCVSRGQWMQELGILFRIVVCRGLHLFMFVPPELLCWLRCQCLQFVLLLK